MPAIHLTAKPDGGGFHYLDPPCGLTHLIVSGYGKAPLGGLLRGSGGIESRQLDDLARRLNAAESIVHSDLPRVVLIETDTEEISTRRIVVTPSGNLKYYGRVTNVWYDRNSRCWKDYVYCVTYAALELLQPRSPSRIGFNHFWGLGSGCVEPTVDAVMNYATNNSTGSLDVVMLYTKREPSLAHHPPEPHRGFPMRRFTQGKLETIELYVDSPIGKTGDIIQMQQTVYTEHKPMVNQALDSGEETKSYTQNCAFCGNHQPVFEGWVHICSDCKTNLFADIPDEHIKNLMDRDEIYRIQTIQWIETHDTENGDRILLESLDDPSPSVRRYAERAAEKRNLIKE